MCVICRVAGALSANLMCVRGLQSSRGVGGGPDVCAVQCIDVNYGKTEYRYQTKYQPMVHYTIKIPNTLTRNQIPSTELVSVWYRYTEKLYPRTSLLQSSRGVGGGPDACACRGVGGGPDVCAVQSRTSTTENRNTDTKPSTNLGCIIPTKYRTH